MLKSQHWSKLISKWRVTTDDSNNNIKRLLAAAMLMWLGGRRAAWEQRDKSFQHESTSTYWSCHLWAPLPGSLPQTPLESPSPPSLPGEKKPHQNISHTKWQHLELHNITVQHGNWFSNTSLFYKNIGVRQWKVTVIEIKNSCSQTSFIY